MALAPHAELLRLDELHAELASLCTTILKGGISNEQLQKLKTATTALTLAVDTALKPHSEASRSMPAIPRDGLCNILKHVLLPAPSVAFCPQMCTEAECVSTKMMGVSHEFKDMTNDFCKSMCKQFGILPKTAPRVMHEHLRQMANLSVASTSSQFGRHTSRERGHCMIAAQKRVTDGGTWALMSFITTMLSPRATNGEYDMLLHATAGMFRMAIVLGCESDLAHVIGHVLLNGDQVLWATAVIELERFSVVAPYSLKVDLVSALYLFVSTTVESTDITKQGFVGKILSILLSTIRRPDLIATTHAGVYQIAGLLVAFEGGHTTSSGLCEQLGQPGHTTHGSGTSCVAWWSLVAALASLHQDGPPEFKMCGELQEILMHLLLRTMALRFSPSGKKPGSGDLILCFIALYKLPDCRRVFLGAVQTPEHRDRPSLLLKAVFDNDVTCTATPGIAGDKSGLLHTTLDILSQTSGDYDLHARILGAIKDAEHHHHGTLGNARMRGEIADKCEHSSAVNATKRRKMNR